jgi:hypothetical protein
MRRAVGYPAAMSTSPLSPDDIRAVVEVHAELGSDYHDAVMESFLAKVDREIDARVEARLVAERRTEAPESRPVVVQRQRAWTAGLATGVTAGILGTGIPLTILVKHVANEGGYSSHWHHSLWIIWMAVLVVYGASAAIIANHNRHKIQLARVARGKSAQRVHNGATEARDVTSH